jgi:hypothetical protein
VALDHPDFGNSNDLVVVLVHQTEIIDLAPVAQTISLLPNASRCRASRGMSQDRDSYLPPLHLMSLVHYSPVALVPALQALDQEVCRPWVSLEKSGRTASPKLSFRPPCSLV